MTGQLLTGMPRSTDGNSAVQAGAMLYFYATGTTTQQAAYADAGLTTPLSNPLIADAGGRYAPAYLDPSKTYRIYETNSGGAATGLDIDPVNTAVGSYITTSTLTTALASYLPLAGGTMTGALSLYAGSTITDVASGTAYAAGYRDLPQAGGAVKTANYTATIADAGKHIAMNGASITATIPANSSVAFPVGTFLTFVNTNATALTIAITTDTMTLANSTTTGARSLAQNGIATAIKIGATSWLISGSGLS